jgi:hypothetical protein
MDDLDEQEQERLRRQEYIRELREEAQKREPISEGDRLRAREYRREVEAERERQQTAAREWVTESIASESEQTPSHDGVSAQWNAWIEERIHAHMQLMTEATGEAMAEYVGQRLDEQRKQSRDELAEEVRRLWAIITELQSTLRALDRIDRAKAAEAPAVHETIQ